MILYVRNKPDKFINFINSMDELKAFIDIFIPGKAVVIGDLSLFSKRMMDVLLKFLEDNPMIDCYSSSDITDPVLLSRFIKEVKDPLRFPTNLESIDKFKESNRDYVSVETYMGSCSDCVKLRLYKASNPVINILSIL